ncbi:MAG: WD40 repeat domain-containing protein, partial [Pseudomonadota bacterium]|nr:WD40 repeat domain-containing protein [Pseudomonadota bacterium]
MTIQRLRIFLSSPGDVASAREIAAQTIERLGQDYARHFQIDEPYMWEHEAMLASGHFQDSVEPPSAFDIVVLILWSRLGTPLPEKTAVREYRGIDGRAPVTGTEWEYEEALGRARREGAPELLVFRSRAPAIMDMRDPRLRDRQLAQAQALDAFWSRHFANQGVFLGAYTEFADDADFAATFENQLRKLIDKRLASPAPIGETASKVWTRPPFRGLEAYEFEHAPIFFGQDEVLTRAMVQLVANAEAGSPFLIVLGASGSGKSSLVKAGIAPKLFVPRRVTGAAFLRRVVFRPSDAAEGEDLFDALARRLATRVGEWEGLAELVSSEITVADLAAHLREAGAEPSLPLRIALAALAARAREKGQMLAYETARLVLVVDQLEELFTTERISAEERRRFIDLLAGLSRSGLVWVVATMRKDFWHRADETPELARLARGEGRLELQPPSPAQLGQMIRRPAEAAGVGFEVHPSTGIALNEVIAEEVAREPGALPLLSYLLDQLYRADVAEAGGATMTYGTYERLGRLEGAIAAKAEAVLAGCAPEDRDALASVLFSLVRMGAADGDVERAISRRVPLSTFPPGSPQRRLVEALLAPGARLLVSDAEAEGNPTVRVAHEALITQWTRARDFVRSNADALKVRRRIEERYRLWRGLEDGEDSGPMPAAPLAGLSAWRPFAGHQRGLLTEIDLADARRLLREHRSEIDARLADYIERSTIDDERIRNRSFRTLAVVAAIVTLLAVVASGAALIARFQTQQTLKAQSRLLTETAAEHLKSGDVPGAQAIILEVLGAGQSDKTRPGSALNVFEEARAADPELAVLAGHRGAVHSAAFSADGRRIVTASDDRTARIWDAATGAQLAVLAGHGGAVESAVFSPDGRRIVTASQDGTARIWDGATGAQLAVLSGHGGPVYAASFSPDGRRIVTGSGDKTARIWNAATGAQLTVLTGHEQTVGSAAFSPDGGRIVTASFDKTARLWNAATGAPLTVLTGHGDVVYSAAFSPDGGRVVTASFDKSARLWDAATGAQLAVLVGHAQTVRSAAFSPDGRRIVTASDDRTARVWDAAMGAQRTEFVGHAAGLGSAAFSPDGRRIVTASEDRTARVWDAASGAQLAQLAGHGDAVETAAFSPDGRRIVTASNDRTARLWDSATGAQLAVLAGHSDGVESAAFSPDGRRIVTASWDRTARIWDGATHAQLAVLSGHRAAVTAASFSRDGRRIVTASWDKTARVWDATTGARLAVLAGHAGAVFSAAFSPDGRRIVTASDDGTARIWDAATGSQLAVLVGHGGAVETAAFSPDGRRIVTASEDRTARIWDGATGAELAVLAGHGGAVESAAFSPDGRRIVTASDDG